MPVGETYAVFLHPASLSFGNPTVKGGGKDGEVFGKSPPSFEKRPRPLANSFLMCGETHNEGVDVCCRAAAGISGRGGRPEKEVIRGLNESF